MNRVQTACRQGASGAAERIGPAAQRTRDMAAERMLMARGWGAPRLHQASRYVEGELGPRMGSMLSDAARRVEPPKPEKQGRNFAVTALAAVMAVGLAGALLTRRGNARSSHEATETERAEVRTP
ncbi:hypothetical protein [Spirillospora sp. NPDC029432]|uniref:hypothetical protein n=1 Tax=Spirillospora sp. NPDC029432 TaxID=3154599 RepID=UPI0034552F9E